MLLGCNSPESTPPNAAVEAALELLTVQTAVEAMMTDNGLNTLPNPVTSATSNMMAFPDITPSGSRGTDLIGNRYRESDKAGFVLHEHDITADNNATTRLISYFATAHTRGTYIVDIHGTVTQVTTGYE